jgi:2-methylisocitrate lyase-like PEP mutase family enzyme
MGKKKKFRDLSKTEKPVVIPGVYDALSARIVELVGFEAVLVSGYGTTASLHAMPDFGLLNQSEVVNTARYIAQAVDIPVIQDADTGYGGPINVIRTVRELENAGVQGMILEDQLWPKRCGHMVGKKVIPMEEYEQKLLAALETRSDPESFLITARTDARGPLGLEEAIKRANRYHELGADAIFVEAPQDKDELRIIRENVPGVLSANMIEGGLTPILSLEEFEELGYQFVGYPLSTVFAVGRALKNVLTELREKGTTRHYEQHLTTFHEFTQMVRLPETFALEQRYSIKD